MLKEGDKVPDITLTDKDGKNVNINKYVGKKIVIYFYSRDNTPGCTREAKSINEEIKEIEKFGAVVIGISPDTPASHSKFSEKLGLNFTLLSDTDHEIGTAFGSWGEVTRCGRTTMGTIRSTFIVDENGVIIKVFPKVRVNGHAEEIISFLKKVATHSHDFNHE